MHRGNRGLARGRQLEGGLGALESEPTDCCTIPSVSNRLPESPQVATSRKG